ncbi:MAG: PEP-CTERM sorting domain-containing protein [Thermoguttaceae bacterium]|nr:PEP-CTERM sorting domain-containing protein [Thermoguttaceae bacterium]
MNSPIFLKKSLLTVLFLLASALVFRAETAWGDVVLEHNFVYTNNVNTDPQGTVTFTNLLYGSGTYSSAIDVGTEGLWIDSTKRVTGTNANIVISNNITAGNFRQVDSDFTVTGGTSYSGSQSGTVRFNNNMTANFSGSFTVGGHTNIRIGTDASSTANVTVNGVFFLGSTMTSNMYVHAGSTFTANNGFVIQNGSQGHLYIEGTVNVNSTQSQAYTDSTFNWDCVSLGTKNNVTYSSSVNVNNGGTLNILNAIAHCGLEGQLFFKINSGGTANLYGLTYSHNNESGQYASAGKTLQLLGGTLNLGAGGIAVGRKPAYPLLFKSGTISTLDGTTSSDISLDVGVGSGTTVLTPKSGATLKFSGTVADATFADVGTGGTLKVQGAGTTEFAGTVSNSTGFTVEGGTANLSGKLTSNATLTSGTLKITSTNTGNTGTITANGGTVNIAAPNVYNGIVFNGGSLLTSYDSVMKVHGPVTLNSDLNANNPNRIEFHLENGIFTGNNKSLVKTGAGEFLFNGGTAARVASPLKEVTINAGTFTLQVNSQAVVDGAQITVNAGLLNLWGQSDVNLTKLTLNGGNLKGGADVISSLTSTTVVELQKNANFETSPYNVANYALNGLRIDGTLQSTTAVRIDKLGIGTLYLAGNMDGFSGTIRSSNGVVQMVNGGNTADTPYAFGFTLNGGSLQFADAGDYYFADGTTLFDFVKEASGNYFPNGSTVYDPVSTVLAVDLGNAVIHVTGEGKITSAIAASIQGGTLDVGSAVFETSAQNNQVKPFELTDVTMDPRGMEFSLTGDNLDYTQLDGQTLMTTNRTDLDGLTFNIASSAVLPEGMVLYGLGQSDGSILIQFGELPTNVPEPASWLLLLAGALLWSVSRIRASRKA